MINSTDGLIVGVDGNIFRWQEETPDISFIYPTIVIAAVALLLAVWLILRRIHQNQHITKITNQH